MADERLRALERQWKETGEDVLGARYLLERLRLGLVPDGGLAMAAWLGFVPARLALDETGAEAPAAYVPKLDEYRCVDAFVDALGVDHGLAPCVRVGLAVAERIVPEYRTLFPEDERVRHALDAVAAWLTAPSAATETACAAAAGPARAAEEAAWTQFQAWGIEFSHEAATFGREGEPGGEDLEELVHDAGRDDFDGFNLCHDRHFDVPFFQIPRLAAHLTEAVAMPLGEGRAAIEHVGIALQQVCEECWETEYDGGVVFGDPYGLEDEEHGSARFVEVAPDPFLQPQQLVELARAALVGWVLGSDQRSEAAEPDAVPSVDDAWSTHLEAFPLAADDLPTWCAELRPFGQALGARIAAATARRCLSQWEARWDLRPREAIAAALAWAECPCPEHAEVCEQACDAAVDAMDLGPRIAEAAARAAEVPLAGEAWPEAVQAVLETAIDEVSLRALRTAIEASFEAWALGLEPGQLV